LHITHLIVVERFYLIIYAKINFASSLLSLLVILEIYPIYINNFIVACLASPRK
jgi:hypothetical protein